MLRGLIRPGTPVTRGLKIGDVDPRGNSTYCTTISEKARANRRGRFGSNSDAVQHFSNQFVLKIGKV